MYKHTLFNIFFTYDLNIFIYTLFLYAFLILGGTYAFIIKHISRGENNTYKIND